jgi:hypothetical protein
VSAVPEPDDLERRLRAALRGVPADKRDPGARRTLLARLRRRRARRRQVVACGAAAVLLLAGGAAYGLSSTDRPGVTSAAPSHAAGAPPPSPRAPSPSLGDVGASGVQSGLSCAQVQVGAAPAACAGAYSPVSPPGAAYGASRADEPSSTVFNGLEQGVATTAPAPLEELREGQSVTVVLPSSAGLSWGAPHVGMSVPSAAATPSSTVVVRLVKAGTGHPAGTTTASFVAAHQGVAVLVADAGAACPSSRAPCGPTLEIWSLQVVVEGS